MSDPERKKAQRREGRAKKQAMTIVCAACGAPVGEPCWREGDRTRGVHHVRREDYLVSTGELVFKRRR